jgi:hypothetical protein
VNAAARSGPLHPSRWIGSAYRGVTLTGIAGAPPGGFKVIWVIGRDFQIALAAECQLPGKQKSDEVVEKPNPWKRGGETLT